MLNKVFIKELFMLMCAKNLTQFFVFTLCDKNRKCYKENVDFLCKFCRDAIFVTQYSHFLNPFVRTLSLTWFRILRKMLWCTHWCIRKTKRQFKQDIGCVSKLSPHYRHFAFKTVPAFATFSPQRKEMVAI